MNQTIFNLKKPYLAIATTLFLMFGLFILAKKVLISNTSSALTSAITLDFALIIPIIYFLLIRKSNVPKTTTIPIFIIGIVIASYVIPYQHQGLLNVIKTWILPIVEFLVATFVIIKVRKLIKVFKKTKQDSLDFFDALKLSTKQLLPKFLANLLTMEIAVFYYGLFKWNKTILKPNQFTHHKTSGTPILLGALILIIGVEMFTVHFLLAKWSWIAALVSLILSVYSAFQILGFLKSLLYRPITITDDTLVLKYGILAESNIKLNTIETIVYYSKEIENQSEIKKLSPLGSLEPHNILIKLKTPELLISLYGSEKQFKAIALYIDNKVDFLDTIENLIHK